MDGDWKRAREALLVLKDWANHSGHGVVLRDAVDGLAALSRLEAREKLLLVDNAAFVDAQKMIGLVYLPCIMEVLEEAESGTATMEDFDSARNAANATEQQQVARGDHPGAALLEENKRLRADSERLVRENKVLREAVEPLAEALRNLLLSRDVAWDGKGLGHDWDEAVKAAAEALEIKP